MQYFIYRILFINDDDDDILLWFADDDDIFLWFTDDDVERDVPLLLYPDAVEGLLWVANNDIELSTLKGIGVVESYELLKGCGVVESYELLKGCGVVESYDLSKGKDVVESYELLKGCGVVESYELLKGCGVVESLEYVDDTVELIPNIVEPVILRGGGVIKSLKLFVPIGILNWTVPVPDKGTLLGVTKSILFILSLFLFVLADSQLFIKNKIIITTKINKKISIHIFYLYIFI